MSQFSLLIKFFESKDIALIFVSMEIEVNCPGYSQVQGWHMGGTSQSQTLVNLEYIVIYEVAQRIRGIIW